MANAHIEHSISITRRFRGGAGSGILRACLTQWYVIFLSNIYTLGMFLLLVAALTIANDWTGTRTLAGRYVSLKIGVTDCTVTDAPYVREGEAHY